MPKWIHYAAKIGLVGRDMHKTGEKMIPEAGGVVVVTAIFISLVYYAVIKIWLVHDQQSMIYILGSIGSILCVTIIGVMDDFQGWKEGLKQWQKPLLTVPAAIPFLLACFEQTTIDLPFFGVREVGLALPLVLVPVGIVGASNAFNMLAGYNGLEAGMGYYAGYIGHSRTRKWPPFRGRVLFYWGECTRCVSRFQLVSFKGLSWRYTDLSDWRILSYLRYFRTRCDICFDFVYPLLL
jgi:hypothetical protein